MDIECTRFINTDEMDCMDYAASAAELGQDAGRITWNNSMELATDFHPITEETADEMRDYFRDFRDYGAWDDEEIAAWTLRELNALVIQEIASNVREFQELCKSSWKDYQGNAQAGTISGNLYRSSDAVYCSFNR